MFLSPCGAVAEVCIEKSLLLFRFTPSGAAGRDSDWLRPAEGSVTPLLRSGSITEGDFQPSPPVGPQAQAAGPEVGSEPRAAEPDQAQAPRVQTQVSTTYDAGSGPNSLGLKGSTESLSSQPGEPASPSTFARRVPFSRGRLRLLSFRSVEEPCPPPSVRERFALLKHILHFMKAQTLTTTRCAAVPCPLTHHLTFHHPMCAANDDKSLNYL